MPSLTDDTSVDALNRWRRSADEFARRIEASDLRLLLQPGVVVEPGTQALIFESGALAATVTAGMYRLQKPVAEEEPKGGWQKLMQLIFGPGERRIKGAPPATAILIDAGETQLPLAFSGLLTKEDISVDATAELIVRLDEPATLYTNVMHGQETLSVEELSKLAWSQSANIVQARIRQTGIDELYGNLQLKTDLAADLQQHVAAALKRNGLELVDLRLVTFSSEEHEPIQRQRAETAVAEQAQEDRERRGKLNQRLRETLTKDRMDKFTSAKDFEQFIRQTEHELGMKEVVRQVEMGDLKRTYETEKEDALIARRHLLEKMELEHELDVQRLRYAGAEEELKHTIERQRTALAARQEADWEAAKQKKRIADLEREARRADEAADLDGKREKLKLGIEAKKQKIELDHTEESQRMQREQEALDRAAKRELEKIHALSTVEQSRLAADLKKTEIMKDMSDDQILALMAKDSPHVAAAIAQRAKAHAEAGANAETRSLYEKILTEKDASADRLERFATRALESMERVAGGTVAREQARREEIKDVTADGMNRMADVATAKAGVSGGDSGSASPANVVCPKCHQQLAAGSKFCDNCGHQFFE